MGLRRRPAADRGEASKADGKGGIILCQQQDGGIHIPGMASVEV